MTLALFDLDNTLLQGDSDHGWGRFLIRKGLVDAQSHAQANEYFYQQYVQGQLDIHEYAAFSLAFLSQHDLATLNAWHAEYMQNDILPIISQTARDLVGWHRAQGHTLIIITATNSFITTPIAAEFNIPHLLAVEPKRTVDGRILPEIEGIPTFQEGKVIRLQAWLAEHNENLTNSYFYSDSHNDLPLLERVDHPIAVDPDPILLAHAQEKDWPIISLRG